MSASQETKESQRCIDCKKSFEGEGKPIHYIRIQENIGEWERDESIDKLKDPTARER